MAKQSNLVRIKRVLTFYAKRGINSERVNILYRKILTNLFSKN